jgi:hypothetical protein
MRIIVHRLREHARVRFDVALAVPVFLQRLIVDGLPVQEFVARLGLARHTVRGRGRREGLRPAIARDVVKHLPVLHCYGDLANRFRHLCFPSFSVRSVVIGVALPLLAVGADP